MRNPTTCWIGRAQTQPSRCCSLIRGSGESGSSSRPLRTVGYVVVTFVYGMEYGGLMAFVDDFFVRPAFRNSGLGTAALAAARDACVMLGVRALSVEVAGDNDPALAVYRRTGFAMTDRKLMVLALAAPTHEQ